MNFSPHSQHLDFLVESQTHNMRISIEQLRSSLESPENVKLYLKNRSKYKRNCADHHLYDYDKDWEEYMSEVNLSIYELGKSSVRYSRTSRKVTAIKEICYDLFDKGYNMYTNYTLCDCMSACLSAKFFYTGDKLYRLCRVFDVVDDMEDSVMGFLSELHDLYEETRHD